MKRVIVAGGSCGSSMQRASEKIAEACHRDDISVKVSIHNLWHSVHIDPRADLVVQMFPFFEKLDCPVFDGRPFIKGNGEADLLGQLIRALAKSD